MLSILIVCTGNTCRSPMAEALLNDIIRQNGEGRRIQVRSAGIAAGGAYPASRGACAVMADRGLDLAKHRSRQLVPQHVEEADLVLTMTGSHKRMLVNMLPAAAERIFTLAEFAGEEADVADPFGGDTEIYRRSADQIEKMIAKAWRKIVDLAGKTA